METRINRVLFANIGVKSHGIIALTVEQEWTVNMMDDTMSKEKAADLLDNLVCMISDTQDNNYDAALRMGIDALTADAVKVVRCKDCYHYDAVTRRCFMSFLGGYEPTDFCSYGERADG